MSKISYHMIFPPNLLKLNLCLYTTKKIGNQNLHVNILRNEHGGIFRDNLDVNFTSRIQRCSNKGTVSTGLLTYSTQVYVTIEKCCSLLRVLTLIARFVEPTWGQHGAHLEQTGPRWAQCWPHELFYLGMLLTSLKQGVIYPWERVWWPVVNIKFNSEFGQSNHH